MNLKIFSIYDQKASAFIPPFFLPTVGMAVRTFSECCTDPDHAFGKHPEDYTLFELGEFDDSAGDLLPHDVAVSHGNGLTHIRSIPHIAQKTEDAA